MNKISFFQKLSLPFYSGEYYRHVVKNNKGFGLKTFFAVLTLNWLVMFLIVGVGFVRLINNPKFQDANDTLARQIPTLTINAGRASFSEPTPYVVNIPETNDPLVVFVSENDVVDSGATDKAIFVVSETEIRINQNGSKQSRSYSMSDIDDMVVDGKMVVEFAQKVFLMVVPILLVMLLLVSYLFRLLQVFVYAAIGQVFNGIFGTSLRYDQMCRLTTAALTPVLVLDLFVFYIWSGPKLWFFNFFLAMAFLGFGVSNQKQTPNAAPV